MEGLYQRARSLREIVTLMLREFHSIQPSIRPAKVLSYVLRLAAAFLIAPLISPLVLIVLRSFVEEFRAQDYVVLAVAYGFFAYEAALLLGLPAYVLFMLLRFRHVAWFGVGGAMIGYIHSIAFLADRASFKNPFTVRDELLAAALSAIAFRFVLGDSREMQMGIKKVIDDAWRVIYHRR